MGIAYADTSALLAMVFDESTGVAVAQRLSADLQIVSSNLLEAEVRAAFARAGRVYDDRFIPRVGWITPERELSNEIARVFRAGYVRGADAWHLATALYVARESGQIAFITLDAQQRRVAEALGFQV